MNGIGVPAVKGSNSSSVIVTVVVLFPATASPPLAFTVNDKSIVSLPSMKLSLNILNVTCCAAVAPAEKLTEFVNNVKSFASVVPPLTLKFTVAFAEAA